MSNIPQSNKIQSCAGRKCSKKKECLRYQVYSGFHSEHIKPYPVSPNSCNYSSKYPNFIEKVNVKK